MLGYCDFGSATRTEAVALTFCLPNKCHSKEMKCGSALLHGDGEVLARRKNVDLAILASVLASDSFSASASLSLTVMCELVP